MKPRNATLTRNNPLKFEIHVTPRLNPVSLTNISTIESHPVLQILRFEPSISQKRDMSISAATTEIWTQHEERGTYKHLHCYHWDFNPASYRTRTWTSSLRFEPSTGLTLTVLVATTDAQWEGMGDAGLARYEPALLPQCPTIRVLSYSN